MAHPATNVRVVELAAPSDKGVDGILCGGMTADQKRCEKTDRRGFYHFSSLFRASEPQKFTHWPRLVVYTASGRLGR
jgi:hypothetical protein